MIWDTFFWSAMFGATVGFVCGAALMGWAESHYGDKR